MHAQACDTKIELMKTLLFKQSKYLSSIRSGEMEVGQIELHGIILVLVLYIESALYRLLISLYCPP